MSIVTNIILTFSSSEVAKTRIEEINKFKVQGREFKICSIDDEKLPTKWYGGTKLFEWNVCIGAYNNLNLEELINHLKFNVEWEHPDYVQLFVIGQNDMSFQLININ